MSSRIFDRDTLLDLTVNIIPIGIMAFFFVVFLVYAPGPFAWDTTFSTIQLALVFVPLVLLAVLTYYAGKAIAGAEKQLGVHAQTATIDPDDGADTDDETDADGETA